MRIGRAGFWLAVLPLVMPELTAVLKLAWDSFHGLPGGVLVVLTPTGGWPLALREFVTDK